MIGLTGTVASGKSTVAGMFAALGAETLSADDLAHQASLPGFPCYDPVVATFGEGILGPDGAIDRKKLGEIVFGDKSKLRWLEEIIHPQVLIDLRRRIQEFRQSKDGAVGLVVEIPLLFEAGVEREFDCVGCCVAEQSVLVSRLTTRSARSEKAAVELLRTQWPQERKADLADFVVRTDCSLEQTEGQVKKVWESILASRQSRQGETKTAGRI